jgi:hypothetical protein
LCLDLDREFFSPEDSAYFAAVPLLAVLLLALLPALAVAAVSVLP